MTNRPRVQKNGTWWEVAIGNHLYASRATHKDAWDFAEGVANYASRIRFNRDLTRITEALERMEKR